MRWLYPQLCLVICIVLLAGCPAVPPVDPGDDDPVKEPDIWRNGIDPPTYKPPLMVEFAVTPASGPVPLALQTTDHSICAKIAKYDWDFGDGARSDLKEPSHVYTQPGIYTLKLTLSGQDGKQASASRIITVYGPPTAAFHLDQTSGAAPLVLHAEDQSISETPIAWYEWDFGDGARSSLATPSHVYTAPGAYTVSLAIENQAGQQASTSQEVTILPTECRIIAPALCRIGKSAFPTLENALPYSCVWSARDGEVNNIAASETYLPPGSPTTDQIRVVFDVEGTLFEITHDIVAYKQFIILKADDLGEKNSRWKRYLDYLNSMGVANTPGIIWANLAKADSAWLQYLLDLQATGLFEFFHHGWDHAQGYNLDGTNPDAFMSEFQGTNYAHQKKHIDDGMAYANSLGFNVTTFGPPFNATDKATVSALNDTSDIKNVLFKPGGTNKLYFNRWANVENGTGNPNFAYFEPQFWANTDKDYLTLQLHPASFSNNDRFLEFEKIIHFLLEQQATFITPEGYRKLVMPEAAGDC